MPCFFNCISQIDQRITEFVTEQQKIDAKRGHDKSELEQFKQDIANANKQKQLISKALENKVLFALQLNSCTFHGEPLLLTSGFIFFSAYSNSFFILLLGKVTCRCTDSD